MYDSPTGIDRLKNFEYPLLQVLTIQVKNLVDYTYSVHNESKPYLALRLEVCHKLVACIVILMNKIEDTQKVHRYLHFCDAGTWNKIINVLDHIYKSELTFMPDLIELAGKLYGPAFMDIDTNEQEDSFEEFIKMLLAIMSKSSDIKAILAAVDAITNIFSDEKFDCYFVKHDIFKILSSGKDTFMDQTLAYANQLEEEKASIQEIDYVSGVRVDFDGFLQYKLEHTQF